jgi:hypothetical protein
VRNRIALPDATGHADRLTILQYQLSSRDLPRRKAIACGHARGERDNPAIGHLHRNARRNRRFRHGNVI